MMNIVALGFLLSSLVTAVIWSPEAPQNHQSMGVATIKPEEEKPKEVLMREGGRVIVLEYEREGLLESAVGTDNQYAKATRENIRDAATQTRHKVEDAGDEALYLIKTGADKTKDAVKATADKAKDTVKTTVDKTSHAFKDSASSALHAAGTVKDRAEEALKDRAHDMYDKTGQVNESAKDKVSQSLGSVKDRAEKAVKDPAHGAYDKTGQVYESAKDKVSQSLGSVKDTAKKAVKDPAHDAYDKTGQVHESAKDKVSQSLGSVKDRAEKSVKDPAHDAYDKTGQVYESAKDKVSQTLGSVKDRAEEAVKDRAHDTYDKTGQMYESAKDKVSQTLGSVKDTGAGVKEALVSHLPDIRQGVNPDRREGNAEDSKDAKTSSFGVEETLKDASERLAEKFTSSKKEAENVDSYKEKIREIFDSAKEKAKKSEDLSRGASTKDSSEHMAGHIYGSAKGKISAVGEKMKEEGEQALKTAGETYDSAKESIKRAGDYVQRTVEDAKESLRVKEHEAEQQGVLKSSSDILYKFRQAVDEVYRLSPELLEAAGKLEKQIIPLLSTRDLKDGASARTANLVKDNVANLTTATVESSKGYYNIVLSRFCRWASKEALKTGLRLVHLLAFATVYGSSMWVNFIGGHVLAKSIPRQQFGFIQSKLYPVYFNTMACGLAICLLAHSAVHPWRSQAKAEKWEDYNLVFSLLLTLANMLYFEPKATKALFERLRIEKEEGRGIDLGDMNINTDNLSMNNTTNATTHDHHAHSGSCLIGDGVNCKLAEVNNSLKVLHRYSSALNMLCLASLTWHLAYLSSYLKI